MNWDALGAMGEIAGTIALIATLFFLARQLQVNTRELERNNEYQRSTSVTNGSDIFNQTMSPLIQDAEFAEIYLKGINGQPLSEVEALRYCTFILTFLSIVEGASESLKADLSFENYGAGYAAIFDQINPFLEKLFNNQAAIKWLQEDAPALFTKEFFKAFYELVPLRN